MNMLSLESNHVEQGTYKIIPKSVGPLETSGLATCSAISFTINDSSIFMAHIDALTNVEIIATKLSSSYQPIQFTNVKIWYGDGFGSVTSHHTQKKITQFAALIGLKIESCKEHPDDIISHNSEDIIQCRKCMAKSGTLKIISHRYQCPYSHPIQVRHPGFMETVYS
jgi:hypothetical protein